MRKTLTKFYLIQFIIWPFHTSCSKFDLCVFRIPIHIVLFHLQVTLIYIKNKIKVFSKLFSHFNSTRTYDAIYGPSSKSNFHYSYKLIFFFVISTHIHTHIPAWVENRKRKTCWIFTVKGKTLFFLLDFYAKKWKEKQVVAVKIM